MTVVALLYIGYLWLTALVAATGDPVQLLPRYIRPSEAEIAHNKA